MQVYQTNLSASDLQLVSGTLLAATVCALSLRWRLLSASGAAAAFVVGAVVFGAGGWRAALPLLMFFLTSNAWGRWRRARKRALDIEKGGPRDAWQVASNGGLPAVVVILARLFPHQAELFDIAFAAAFAEANADTWATEVGAGANQAPRLITTFARVSAGRSGAVSLVGTLAAVAGAAVVGLASLPLFDRSARGMALGIVVVAGIAGALMDSLLGATAQAQEIGGRKTGIAWIGNDLVNFLASAFAALAGICARLFF